VGGNRGEGSGLAQQIEAAAYEVVYLVYGFACTFWDFLFRPELFMDLSGISKLEGVQEERVDSPYVLPMTYAVFALLALVLYLPAIIAFQPADYPLLGGATLHERIAVLHLLTSAVMSAKMSQIVLILVPLIIVASLYAVFCRLFLGLLGLPSTFETQLKIESYAAGTQAMIVCLFMSPRLFHVPMIHFAMDRGSASAELLYGVIAGLMLATFGLAFWRYVDYVRHACGAGRGGVWRVALAVLAASSLCLAVLWLMLTFWFPFISA